MQKTILITWWLGYIGSHWVVAFEQAWYKTVIVDNLSNSDIYTLDNMEKILWYKPDFFQADLREKEKLREVFKKYDFDGVIHFAWLKSVWESWEKALEYYDNNVIWSLRLFELLEKYNVKNIIFSSSATVYEASNFISLKWVKEDGIVWNCTNPYGTTKFIIENILKDLANFSWFRVMNLRYFNPIWAHKSWFIWEAPIWIPNNLLPYIMKVAIWELAYLNVFWNDYPTVDGTWVRDYIDVVDLIDAHLKAYEKLKEVIKNGIYETYNLWTGKWISVFEMLWLCEKVVWKKIDYVIGERRNADLASVFCNPEKAEKELGWKSKISLLESLENSWRFYNK